jgi:hypothetical protein
MVLNSAILDEQTEASANTSLTFKLAQLKTSYY